MTNTTTFRHAQALGSGTTSLHGVAGYYWGQNAEEKQTEDFVKMNTSLNVSQKGSLDLMYPSNTAGSEPMDQIQIGPFQPVNCIPFYYMLGAYNATTKVISPFVSTTGQKPRWKSWKRYGDYVRHSFDNVLSDMRLFYSIDDPRLICSMSAKGQSWADIAYASCTPSALSFPSDQSTTYCLMTHIKWNTTALTTPVLLEVNISQELKPTLGLTEGYYVEISDRKLIFATVSLTYLGFNAGLEADYVARTLRTLEWKQSKINGDYFTFSAANAIVKHSNPLTVNGEILAHTVVIACAGITITQPDPTLVAETFFGEED